VERIADQKRALQAPHFQHASDCPHRLARGASFILHQDCAVRYSVFLRVVSSHGCFTGGIAETCSARENQQRSKMTVPEIQGVIESGAQHW